MIIKAYVGDCGQCQYLHMDKEGVFDLSANHDGSTLGFVSLFPPSMSCDKLDRPPILGRACPCFSMGCPPSILFYPEQIVEIPDLIKTKEMASYWRSWVGLMDSARESRNFIEGVR